MPSTDAVGHIEPSAGPGHKEQWLAGAMTALGVVYGDIGTSPLYAFQVALGATGHAGPSHAEVFGLVSLIFWAIVIVVALKYVTVVMRADNEGEGGILALLSLVISGKSDGRAFPLVMILGVTGAAFIYGDGMITPAISVLSALEGLEVAAPGLESYILPATLVILVGLFAIQSRGTGTIGQLFSPIMIAWFVAIGLIGLWSILRTPQILAALDPLYAIEFVSHAGRHLLPIVGAAFLALTGAEALYADMGHVGAPAVRRAWFGLVLPALALCYLGQGATVLRQPDAAENPFFKMTPGWATLPLVILAAMATVIASQAMISGAYSLTRQGMQMRLWPRMRIASTSGRHQGQIYIGFINWALMIGTILVVLIFRTSAHLASAYGIAVSGTMLVTSILLFDVVRRRWRWPFVAAVAIVGLFTAVDVMFLVANATKFAEGGWFPLVVGAALAFLMLVWRGGTLETQRRLEEQSVPFDEFLAEIDTEVVSRVPGCAVVLTRTLDYASPVLVRQVRHNRVLHEDIILLTIEPVHRPFVSARERLEVTTLSRGFHRVIAKLGFMQAPDLASYMRGALKMGLECAGGDIHYLVAYEHVARRRQKPHFPVLLWYPYSLMSKTGVRLTDFMQIPEENVFEIGVKVQI